MRSPLLVLAALAGLLAPAAQAQMDPHQHHRMMAHDALAKSTNPTIRRFARGVIVAQRAEIMELRRMLALEGLRKPEYRKYDALFNL